MNNVATQLLGLFGLATAKSLRAMEARALDAECMVNALVETARKEGDVVVDAPYGQVIDSMLSGRIIFTRAAHSFVFSRCYSVPKDDGTAKSPEGAGQLPTEI